MHSSALRTRPYRPGDERAILDGLERAFAPVDPSFPGRTESEWRWRFADGPAGSRIELLVDSGRVLAQYASVGQRFRRGPERVTASHAVDSFRVPGVSARAFVATGRAFAARHGADRGGADAFMWGLPVPAARRLGERFLGYVPVCTLSRLVLAVGGSRGASERPADVEVREVASAPSGVDGLFERVAAEGGLRAERTPELLDWRFLRAPGRPYRLAVAARRGRPVGLCVHRRGVFEHERGGLVCDWLVPADEPGAARALLGWLRDRTRADGDRTLTALFLSSAPEFALLQEHGFRVLPTSRVLVARSYRRDLDVETLRDALRVTLADTDLC